MNEVSTSTIPIEPASVDAADDRGSTHERALFERFVSGDVDALPAIVAAARGRVIGALRRRFAAAVDAEAYEDAFADAIVRLHERRASLRPGRIELGAWLYVVARNLLATPLRRRPAGEAATSPTPAPMPAALRDVGDARLAAIARDVIDALAPRDRAIVEAYLDRAADEPGGWATRVARRLGLDASHVRVLRHRAFKKVRAGVLARVRSQAEAHDGQITERSEDDR